MDGGAFLSLALQLANGDTEARLRTSVSRAYYGAYHVARELVENCGVVVPKRDVHNKLQWCLEQVGQAIADVELAKAGSKLGSLRTDRNRADYDLGDPSFTRKINALKAAKKAHEVTDAIGSLVNGAGMQIVRQYIRRFAQQESWQLI